MIPFSTGLVRMMSMTVPWISQAPAPTSRQTSSIVVMARIGWLKVVATSARRFSVWDMLPSGSPALTPSLAGWRGLPSKRSA